MATTNPPQTTPAMTYMSEAEYKTLTALALRNERSIAAEMRLAVRAWLAQHEAQAA